MGSSWPLPHRNELYSPLGPGIECYRFRRVRIAIAVNREKQGDTSEGSCPLEFGRVSVESARTAELNVIGLEMSASCSTQLPTV